MIKKNTKVIFIDENNNTDELIGGIPLTIGEVIKVKKNDVTVDYEVINKEVEFIFGKTDQDANITYTLKKK